MRKSTSYSFSLCKNPPFITDSFIAYIDMVFKTIISKAENGVNLCRCA